MSLSFLKFSLDIGCQFLLWSTQQGLFPWGNPIMNIIKIDRLQVAMVKIIITYRVRDSSLIRPGGVAAILENSCYLGKHKACH